MAKVLIIDDEKSTAALLTQALAKGGHDVSASHTASDVVALVLRHRPDLVIMDMSMPKTTGWEATRALKANAETRAIPVLGLSAATTTGDRDEAYAAGCEGYESKPIDIPRLLERVKELTGQ